MKKLQGMKNGFSSLENKQLKDLQSIRGGDDSARTSSQSSSGSNSSDTVYYKDGIKTMTLVIEGPNPTTAY
ncbi:TIGR04139 family peptide modification target [Chryseobacterium lathyri]|uniref:TIGR04139 family peptide modification target n=1 Tax=Chryseobacterium lathyri TaxID=395933 RepID=UPI0027831526|nr:TIGR04139 family peptide modification target [Chryseobacterium lathyri]MDQ0065899.1 putative peptide modification target (TIGR04139 family) [Chryseobacterium lathyri]